MENIKKGDILYHLTVVDGDDFSSKYDAFTCQELIIEDVIDCMETVQEGNEVVKKRTFQKIKTKDKNDYIEFYKNGKFFKTIDEVIESILKKYLIVHEDDHYIVLLSRIHYGKTIVINKYGESSYSLPKTFIDLEDALNKNLKDSIH